MSSSFGCSACNGGAFYGPASCRMMKRIGEAHREGTRDHSLQDACGLFVWKDAMQMRFAEGDGKARFGQETGRGKQREQFVPEKA